MVEHDIADRGIRDARVLSAMRDVPRHRFVPAGLTDSAHDDRALPIGKRQTISQPYIVALMAEAAELTPASRVLEVGSGSGYGAAVLAELAAEVWTIERHEALAESARSVLDDIGVRQRPRGRRRRHPRPPRASTVRRDRRHRRRGDGAARVARSAGRRRATDHARRVSRRRSAPPADPAPWRRGGDRTSSGSSASSR